MSEVIPQSSPQRSLTYSNVAKIPEVVASARDYFASGATRSIDWRRKQLEGIARLCKEEESAIAAALTEDLGRPAFTSFTAEINFVRNEAKHALKLLKQWMAPEKVATPLALQPASSTLLREPLGVVLIISPWNYPFQLLVAPLVAALAAGNTAVLKPSELAPATAALVERLLPRYVDRDAVRVVQGEVPETTALLEERFDDQ